MNGRVFARNGDQRLFAHDARSRERYEGVPSQALANACFSTPDGWAYAYLDGQDVWQHVPARDRERITREGHRVLQVYVDTISGLVET